MRYFETKFLEEAEDFIAKLDHKVAKKVFYNIDLAEHTNDSELFKKLRDDIWEFRCYYNKQQIRLLAFWENSKKGPTLVFATHGFVKKTDKVSDKEIEKAKRIRIRYFENISVK